MAWRVTPPNPSDAVCMDCGQYPASALAPQKWRVLVFLYLIVHNLPQLHIDAVSFSPLSFLCIVLLQRRFVQVQALHQRISGPRSQAVSLGSLSLFLNSPLLSYPEVQNLSVTMGGRSLEP